MLAIVYLILSYLLGDTICRRFFSYVSVQHRVAVSFLAGLLFATVFTYFVALAFAWTSEPLIWANLVFAAVALSAIYFLGTERGESEPGDGLFRHLRTKFASRSAKNSASLKVDADRRPAGDNFVDWIVISICLFVSIKLMFATLGYWDGSFQLAIKSWSDFGPNISVSQSFALGHNFPTEHPFFPGELIRYHFLFWFLAANLSFLGVNLVWCVNILSALTLVALLMLIMTFVEIVFNSRAVARLSVGLFFFASSSLSYIPFLMSQSGVGGAWRAIVGLKDFIKSGFPYRGDDWGALSIAVYADQRHLISAIGIMMIVLVYLVDLYRRRGAITIPGGAEPSADAKSKVRQKSFLTVAVDADMSLETKVFIFCGVLLGGLPYWNGAVFFSAALIVGGLLVIFPFRRQLLCLIGTTVVLGLPQLVLLGAGGASQTGRRSIFTPGYIITDPTILKVVEYIGWTFGLKLVLVAIALYLLPRTQRWLFLIFTGLLTVVFMFQLSSDPFNNHKLLNIWNIFAVAYSAYALWFIGRKGVAWAALAVFLGIGMSLGSVIDLFPLHNDGTISVPFENDPLTTWMLQNTKPTDIFLSDRLLSHPILFTGRKLYLGDPLYPTSAGHDILKREATYKELFQMRSPELLIPALQEKHIAYVAVDDGLRNSQLVPNFSDAVFQNHFEKVFEDTEGRYRNLVIYKVPERPR